MTTEAQKETLSRDAAAGPGRGAEALGWIQKLWSAVGLTEQRSLRDTLEGALSEDGGEDVGFSAEERQMLSRLLRFSASRVDAVMVPRADIIALEESEPLGELVRTFEEAGISRIPIFHDTLDDPRGMIHIKDLFRWISAEVAGRQLVEPVAIGTAGPRKPGPRDDAKEPPQVAKADLTRFDLSRPIAAVKLRRPVLYVPPSMPAINLLVRMQATRIHMALVVDEYGGTDGLVTIEDLIEQIVGDIEDEHDEAEDAHIAIDPKLGLVASARTPIAELEERLETKLLKPDEEEDVDTLGGLVFSILGRIPARGEIIRHASGIEFEVLDADPRRVKKLKIHVPKPAVSRAGA